MENVELQESKEIEKIVIHFEDGTTKEVDEGMVVSLQEKEEDQLTINMECCHIGGTEYQNMMYGLLKLASGIFRSEDL